MTLIQALEIVIGLAEIGDDEKEPDQIEALDIVNQLIEEKKSLAAWEAACEAQATL